MARLPPATSQEIAREASLSERYVRERLAVMVSGGIVNYDPSDRRYQLPADHAACLTRNALLGNLALYGQHVAIMGAVQDRILDCFETGAGTRYADYPCFHQIMAEDSNQTVTAQLVDVLLPLEPGLIERLEAGIEVLDAGCGRGAALLAMAQRDPASRFTGIDLGRDAIEHARHGGTSRCNHAAAGPPILRPAHYAGRQRVHGSGQPAGSVITQSRTAITSGSLRRICG